MPYDRVMDKIKASHDIIQKALPHIPFDGWNQQTLGKAAIEAGYKKTDVIRVFPGGTLDAIDAYLTQADEEMLEIIAGYNLDSMKIRERIASAVQAKLNVFAPSKEALRRAMAIHAMPFNMHRAMRAVYQTVDNIWFAIGDTSTDFNFYTKRLTLAGVYSTTLLYWLDDQSSGFEKTWEFLDRRINDVMKIERAKAQIRTWSQKNFA